MFFIKSEVEFDMAHFLSGYKGKCSNIHGHRYKVIASFMSAKLKKQGNNRGMVEDFAVIKGDLKEIAKRFDHKLVIEKNDEGEKLAKKIQSVGNFDIYFVNYRPTAEEMARDIFFSLKKKELPIYSVELFETPKNSCIYMED